MTQQRKPTSNNLGDDGKTNPPHVSLENSHKLAMKRKRVNSQQEGGEQNIPKYDIFLDDIDLDVDIENIWFLDEEEHAQENVQSATLVVKDEVFFNEQNF
jgi:hypothetical protein